MNKELFDEAQRLLKEVYGDDARFRDGQYEAIEAVLTRRRTLVVQRTGWGKSLIYFICTRFQRARGKGMTLVVSPLLVLMENQLEAAEKHGLVCAQLNSTIKTRAERTTIMGDMLKGRLDLLFITPETLFAKDVQPLLPQISIGLLVIDEAHCISDWGHDFRLEYGQLRDIIQLMPSNVPVLGTTATANERVVEDLREQLGEDLFVSSGPLTRESLYLQVLDLRGVAERYAWILENLEKLPGSGIIYCLTQKDCDMLAGFLIGQGIKAAAYHSGLKDDENQEAIDRFSKNELKVVVATVKLGMGYDKGDIAFVIHFQMPSNIVSYYQQIGRAGREIPRACVFLMTGAEAEDINKHFITSAFPTREEMDQVMGCIRNAPEGLKTAALEASVNMSRSRRDKAIMFLLRDGYIYVERNPIRYFASPKPYRYNGEHYQKIRDIRVQEMEQMKELVTTRECLSKFIARCLDDEGAQDCGHCVNCTGGELLPVQPSPQAIETAQLYLNKLYLPIKPKFYWPPGVLPTGEAASADRRTKLGYVNREGLCMSKYGASGCGQMVKRAKYSEEKRFPDILVERSASKLAEYMRERGIEIKAVTCVPSLRSDLVENFARRLAERLGLPFASLLRKRNIRQQKEMENGVYQCRNALNSFLVRDGVEIPSSVLLVDDIVDSGWTLTVCGYRLMEKECKAVYPFALADSSHNS